MRVHKIGAAVVLATVLASAAAGAAENAQVKPVDTRPRLVVDATYYPFSAVGRLQAAGQVFCSAALVGPRVILTAGHCLWDFKRKKWRPASDIHFVAGYQRSSFVAHGQGVRYVSPLTAENKAPDGASVPHDWALVELNRDIGRDVGWLGILPESPAELMQAQKQDFAASSPLFLVAYREDRAHALSLQSPCRIVREAYQGGVMLNDCQVVHGSSGSPLLAYRDGLFWVAGVTSARVSFKDQASQTATISTAVFRNTAGAEAFSSYKLSWQPPTVRDATLTNGSETLAKALSDTPAPGGDVKAALRRLLLQGPTHDKIALPPLPLPELQKCRGDCATSNQP